MRENYLLMRSSYFLLLLLLPLASGAQTVISGTLQDTKAKPLAGASISIKDTYDGATVDSLGKFRFKTTETGTKILTVSLIGYKSLEQPIELNASPIQLSLVMKESPNELSAVVITAGSFEASDSKRTTVLTSIDIATTASANADVTSAIKTLTGAQQVGESEGLFVRGGTASESKVFIDGTLVNNFFFSSVPDLAQRGRFSPFLFKGTVFSSGGYSALYGQALSAAVILESIDLPDRSSASAGISTVGLNAGYQQLAKNKKSSWGINYNLAHLGLYFALVKQNIDNYKVPVFHNADFNFRIKTSKTGIIKFYSYLNLSKLGVRRPDIDSLSLKDAFTLGNTNVYANLSYKEKLSSRTYLNIGTSYSYNYDDISQELQDKQNKPAVVDQDLFAAKTFNVDAYSNTFALKPVLERRFGSLSALRGGVEFIAYRNKNEFTNKFVNRLVNKADEDYAAAFVEADVYITNDLAAKAGLRSEHSSIIDRSNIAPRLSLAYRTGMKGQISFAYGQFYQQPEKDLYLRGTFFNEPGFQKATHYILNYQVMSRDYTLRTEVFYKKYQDLMKTKPGNDFGVSDTATNNGDGYAKGIEVFWRDRKSLKGVDYWIGYSYLDTKRDHLHYPGSLEPTFAARHTFNFVIKKFVTKMKTQFNASYNFATGRPYYRFVNEGGKTVIADNGRTIPFHNLSLSINYLPFIQRETASSFTVFVFSVNNVLGSKQVFGYNYSANGTVKQPILPPAKTFYFLGCFISFGTDRTQEIINSNL